MSDAPDQPIFPKEIFQVIIGALEGDRSTRLRCSEVCWLWCTLSREVLLDPASVDAQRICTFDNSLKSSASFVELYSVAHSTLPNYVRCVVINATSHFPPSEPLIHLFSTFRRYGAPLTYLEAINVYWMMALRTEIIGVVSLGTITTLSLDNNIFMSIGDLFELLQKLPLLRNLSIQNVQRPVDKPSPGMSLMAAMAGVELLSPTFQLRSLKASVLWQPVLIVYLLGWLAQHPNSLECLRRCDVGVVGDEATLLALVGIAKAVLDGEGGILREFEIYVNPSLQGSQGFLSLANLHLHQQMEGTDIRMYYP